MDMEAGHMARLLALAEHLTPHLTGPSAAMLARQLGASGVKGTLGGHLAAPEVSSSWLEAGRAAVTPERVEHWQAELERLATDGVTVVTTGDAEYPRNLRLINDHPPILFVRGSVVAADERSMAVVGTRHPSPEGISDATKLARGLAECDVTVVSGLAQGIDSAAHTGALVARGRTLAVFGTGIRSTFPAANRGLARRVAEHGACLSQFWPDQQGARWTFPLRNIVTSGLSIGTVVVEAGESSGARLQAQDALRHGKQLFLMERLVTTQPWANEMAGRPGVTVVQHVDEVIEALEFDLHLPELDLVL